VVVVCFPHNLVGRACMQSNIEVLQHQTVGSVSKACPQSFLHFVRPSFTIRWIVKSDFPILNQSLNLDNQNRNTQTHSKAVSHRKSEVRTSTKVAIVRGSKSNKGLPALTMVK
jgi:hypothetical protein